MKRSMKEGYAWAESGHSTYDVIAVVDWWNMLQKPYSSTPQAREASIYKKLHEAFDDDDGLLERLLKNSAYREGWIGGVIAFYHETIA